MLIKNKNKKILVYVRLKSMQFVTQWCGTQTIYAVDENESGVVGVFFENKKEKKD